MPPDPITPSWLREQLKAAFEEQPSEPGTDHPKADEIIFKLTSDACHITTLTAVASNCDGKEPALAYATLVRIAHNDLPWPDDAKANLIRRALQNPDLLVRDGAIQVAEAWPEPFTLEVLKAHQESQEWLAGYVSEVISDIAESIQHRGTVTMLVQITEADIEAGTRESPTACPVANAVGSRLREINPKTGEYVDASPQRISIFRYATSARSDYWTSDDLAEWMRTYDRGTQVPPITIELQGEDAKIVPEQESES